MNRRRKKKSRKWMLIFPLILILLFAGFYYAKQQGMVGKRTYTKIAAEPVKKRTIIETVAASGKLYPETEVKVTPDVSGEIIYLNVVEGDSVRQGELIARIQPDLQESLVEQAEAAVNTAKSNIKNLEARVSQVDIQIEKARVDYNRTKKLFDEEVISLVELQNAEAALRNLEAEKVASIKSIEGAVFNVESAEAGFRESKKNLAKTNIYAPISGIVSTINVEKGERVVGTSQFEGTEMMRISNYSNFEVQVEVSENDIIKVKEGDTAIVEIDAYFDREFLGVVKQISNAQAGGALASLSTDQVTNYTVKIILLQSSYKDLMDKARNSFIFRPGMSASVEIQTKKLNGVLTVPIQSVTIRQLADSLKKDENQEEMLEVVFVYNEGKVEQRTVKTAEQDDTYILISEGLENGEEIVNAPYRAISKQLKHDMEVEKVEKKDLFKDNK